MPLDDVAAERLAGPERRFEVDRGAGGEGAERGAGERFRHRVEREAIVVDLDDGQAAALDGDRVADRDLRRGARRPDAEADAVRAALDGGDTAALADDPGEHGRSVMRACGAIVTDPALPRHTRVRISPLRSPRG